MFSQTFTIFPLLTLYFPSIVPSYFIPCCIPLTILSSVLIPLFASVVSEVDVFFAVRYQATILLFLLLLTLYTTHSVITVLQLMGPILTICSVDLAYSLRRSHNTSFIQFTAPNYGISMSRRKARKLLFSIFYYLLHYTYYPSIYLPLLYTT